MDRKWYIKRNECKRVGDALMSKYSCDSCMSKLCAKKVPIFSFLSDDELRKIISMTGHLQFKKGEALC